MSILDLVSLLFLLFLQCLSVYQSSDSDRQWFQIDQMVLIHEVYPILLEVLSKLLSVREVYRHNQVHLPLFLAPNRLLSIYLRHKWQLQILLLELHSIEILLLWSSLPLASVYPLHPKAYSKSSHLQFWRYYDHPLLCFHTRCRIFFHQQKHTYWPF